MESIDEARTSTLELMSHPLLCFVECPSLADRRRFFRRMGIHVGKLSAERAIEG